jgi:hypothetical protein
MALLVAACFLIARLLGARFHGTVRAAVHAAMRDQSESPVARR